VPVVPQPIAPDEELLEALKEYVESKHGDWAPGWRVGKKMRAGGGSAGAWDVYYYSPCGKRFRSKQEVTKWMGVEGDRRRASRVDAAAAAAAFAAAAPPLPLHLPNGVTLESLGALHARPGFFTGDDLWPVGLRAAWDAPTPGVGRFVSAIEDGGESGPEFVVTFVPARDEDAGGADAASGVPPPPPPPAELARTRGDPDAAWDVVTDLLLAALDAALAAQKAGAAAPCASPAPGSARASPAPPAPPPRGGARVAAMLAHLDALGPDVSARLAKATAAAGGWGTERFGLGDIRALKLIEALPAVPPAYRYLEQRSEWDDRAASLGIERQRAARKAERAVRQAEAKARRLEAAAAKAGAKRARGAARGAGALWSARYAVRDFAGLPPALAAALADGANPVDAAVGRVVLELVDGADRALDTSSAARARASGASRSGARSRAGALGGATLARHADLVDDADLPGGDDLDALPAPVPIGDGALAPPLAGGALELWQAGARFADVLELHPPPSLAAIGASLTSGAVHGAAQRVQAALVRAIVSEIFDAGLDMAGTACADVRKREMLAAFPAITPFTWPELARRLLLLAANARLVAAGAACGGGDGVLGAHIGASPLASASANAALQYVAAGMGVVDPAHAIPALPLAAAPRAAAALIARQHATSLRASLDRVATAAGIPSTPAAAADAILLACRRLVVDAVWTSGARDCAFGGRSGGYALLHDGSLVAAAIKNGGVVDLASVSARVEARVYDAALGGGVAAAVADVEAVVAAYHAAATRRHGSVFVDHLRALRVGDVCVAVDRVADRATRALAEGGPAAVPCAALAAGTHAGEGGSPSTTHPPACLTASCADASRAFEPVDGGCVVCWDVSDPDRTLACDGCGTWRHTYCALPPLDDVPDGDWFCSACVSKGKRGAGATAPPPSSSSTLAVSAARARAEPDEFADAAAALASAEYGDLPAASRVRAARALATLFTTGVNVREALADDDARKKAARKAVADAKKRGKRMREGSVASDGGGGSVPPADLRRWPPRRDPMGMDRGWRRYWALPGSDVDAPAPGCGVFVEEAPAGGDAPGAPPPNWLWLPHRGDVEDLLDACAPQGVRESALAKSVKALLKAGGGDGRPALGASSDPPPVARDSKAEAAAAATAVAGALAAIPGDALRAGEWAPKILTAALALARTPSPSPPDLMAAMVAAEAAVDPARFKPWWRLWAAPAPPPVSAASLAPVRLRAAALAVAVRPATVPERGTDGVGPASADPDGLPFKGKGVQGLYGVAAAGDGGVSWRQPGRPTKAQQAAADREAKAAAADAAAAAAAAAKTDEQLARELQAAENAGRRRVRPRGYTPDPSPSRSASAGAGADSDYSGGGGGAPRRARKASAKAMGDW
jgi:hypothetical protein